MHAVNALLFDCLCLASKLASWVCKPVDELVANTWCVQVLRGVVYIAEHLAVQAPLWLTDECTGVARLHFGCSQASLPACIAWHKALEKVQHCILELGM
jgi:hypothetical protein